MNFYDSFSSALADVDRIILEMIRLFFRCRNQFKRFILLAFFSSVRNIRADRINQVHDLSTGVSLPVGSYPGKGKWLPFTNVGHDITDQNECTLHVSKGHGNSYCAKGQRWQQYIYYLWVMTLEEAFEELITAPLGYQRVKGETAMSFKTIRQNWTRGQISVEKMIALLRKAGYDVEITVNKK